MNVSVNVDASKGNVGANFSLEPRFLSKALDGAGQRAQIPAAGSVWVWNDDQPNSSEPQMREDAEKSG